MGAKRNAAESMNWLALLMEQDRWWRTNEDGLVRLDRMTPEHRLNLLAFLRRRARTYAAAHASRCWRSYLSIGPDPSDGVFWAAEGWLAEAEAAERDPDVWLAAQPLYQKLVQLVRVDTDAMAGLIGRVPGYERSGEGSFLDY
jgi:hypothetical protein